MGFGILFFAYFITFAFDLSQINLYVDIVGVILMLYAFSKLAEYNTYYRKASWAAFPILALCLYTLATMFLGRYEPDSTAAILVQGIKLIPEFAVHVFVFLGIRGISMGADCEKLVKRSERQLIMTTIYYVAAGIVLLLRNSLGEYLSIVGMGVKIYWVICFVLNLALIYTAFGLLYPAEEENAPPKRSRFKLFNKLEDKMDEFEENSNRYRRESMEMAQAEALRLAKEKQKKKKHQNYHPKKKR